MASTGLSLTIPNGAAGVPLGMILSYHATRDRQRAALIVNGQEISFAELDARANRRARMFARHGVGQDDFVTIALPNSVEFYESSFAVWKLGAIPNIVSPKLPQREIDAIVGLVQPRLIVGLGAGSAGGPAVVPAETPIDEALSPETLEEAVSRNWKAMTSGGSTGRPKVILDAMPGRWDPHVGVLGQSAGSVLLNPGPLYHNGPFMLIHTGLFAGGTVVDMVKFDALRALELIDADGVTWVNLVPTMMQRIWRLGPDVRSRFSLASLERVFHMAAPCPAWLKEEWIAWLGGDRLYEVYAGTERQGSTMISGTDWLSHRGSVGKPQPGARIRVLDEAQRDCPPREIGEIFLLPDGGPNSTYRYIGADAKRCGDWESLGDLGWFDEDGYLYLSDRRTDLIISGGANIYPAEVEAALDAHPLVGSSVVIGLPDEEWGERVHAIIQPVAGANLDAAELLIFLGERLTRYKLPKTIEFTTQPLRDDAGKVRRVSLRTARMNT